MFSWHCSDLHMYEGRTGAKPGIVFGHEKFVVFYSTALPLLTKDPWSAWELSMYVEYYILV
jgi:hypothetical protein